MNNTEAYDFRLFKSRKICIGAFGEDFPISELENIMIRKKDKITGFRIQKY